MMAKDGNGMSRVGTLGAALMAATVFWGAGPPIAADQADTPPALTLEWEGNILRIRGGHLPGGVIEIHYLEAYCRGDSHTNDWVEHTVVGHETELVSRSDDGTKLALRCRVRDGLIVDHRIEAGADEVAIEIDVHNPTDRPSEAQWAQPCVRVGAFSGLDADTTDDAYAYVRKCFVFLDGRLERMPTRDWATEARYIPGQVWAGPEVAAEDVNPRPLNPHRPSNGLIGCFSGDENLVLALAFEPWQELFQGVIRCIHSDFRLGIIEPGQRKRIRGRIYVVPNDIDALLARYRADFPEARDHESSGGGESTAGSE